MKNKNCKLAFVVDTNIIISALVRDSVTRRILTETNLNFYYPDCSLSEITKHKETIIKKAGIDNATFEIIIGLLFNKIIIIKSFEYYAYIKEAEKILEDRDITDAPFLALAMSKNIPIWSGDKDFLAQNKVKIYNTNELIRLLLQIK